MRIAHRYVLRTAFAASLGGVLFFGFTILVATIFRDMLEMLVEGRLTTDSFVRLSLIALPYVLIHALPMGLLAGTLLAVGRLSSENEILAFRASGMGVAQLSSSIVAMAIFASALSLLVNLEYGPRARATYRRELAQSVGANPLGFLLERTFVKDFPGYVVYVGEKQGELLLDLWVWSLDEQARVKRFIRAESGLFKYDADTGLLNLTLSNGSFEDRDGTDPEDFKTSTRQLSFGQASVPLPLDRILGRASFQKKLFWMPFQELLAARLALAERLERAEAREVESARVALMEASMTLHEKFASSFAPLSLTLVAIPLGLATRRKETAANLALALGLALVYYVAMVLIGWMGAFPGARPDLWYWAPNFVFQALGLWLMVRIDRGRNIRSRAWEDRIR